MRGNIVTFIELMLYFKNMIMKIFSRIKNWVQKIQEHITECTFCI